MPFGAHKKMLFGVKCKHGKVVKKSVSVSFNHSFIGQTFKSSSKMLFNFK